MRENGLCFDWENRPLEKNYKLLSQKSLYPLLFAQFATLIQMQIVQCNA